MPIAKHFIVENGVLKVTDKSVPIGLPSFSHNKDNEAALESWKQEALVLESYLKSDKIFNWLRANGLKEGIYDAPAGLEYEVKRLCHNPDSFCEVCTCDQSKVAILSFASPKEETNKERWDTALTDAVVNNNGSIQPYDGIKDFLSTHFEIKQISIPFLPADSELHETSAEINYFRKNAEEDYVKTPISVLRYISELEQLFCKETPAFCEGEKCSVCGKPANHKVGEEEVSGHNLTAYVCQDHFEMVFMPYKRTPASKEKPDFEKMPVLKIGLGQSFVVEGTFFIAGKEKSTGKILIFETNDPNYARGGTE